MVSETFRAEVVDTFQNLQRLPELPVEVRKVFAEKEPAISRYMERLKQFSIACRGDKKGFYITHGDAGGNCILNGGQLFLVDWDSAMLAPIERDAWISICDEEQLEKINLVLVKNEIDYCLDQTRLCYYCYSFFFHYLNKYLKSLVNTESDE